MTAQLKVFNQDGSGAGLSHDLVRKWSMVSSVALISLHINSCCLQGGGCGGCIQPEFHCCLKCSDSVTSRFTNLISNFKKKKKKTPQRRFCHLVAGNSSTSVCNHCIFPFVEWRVEMKFWYRDQERMENKVIERQI